MSDGQLRGATRVLLLLLLLVFFVFFCQAHGSKLGVKTVGGQKARMRQEIKKKIQQIVYISRLEITHQKNGRGAALWAAPADRRSGGE